MGTVYRDTCALLAGLALAATVAPAAAAPGGSPQTCNATIRLADAVTLGALQLDVDYPHPDAAFDGTDTAVDCTNFTTALPSFQDDDVGTLGLALVAFGGSFSGPGKLATCRMTNAVPITAADLQVTVIDASDPQANPVSPLPNVTVSLICAGSGTTTTSSTTTTTLPTSEQCTIRFEVPDTALIGSLQVDVDYSGADGEFDGAGSNARCTNLVSNAIGSYNDEESSLVVTAATIKLGGFQTPKPIFECTFLPASMLPIPADFVVTVTDAGDPDSNPIVPAPTVVISAIECFDPTATTTTTTTTSTTSTTLPPLCGDADFSGVISASDSQRILHCALGLLFDCTPGVCDASGDGNLTVADAQRVLRYAVGLPTSLLCP